MQYKYICVILQGTAVAQVGFQSRRSEGQFHALDSKKPRTMHTYSWSMKVLFESVYSFLFSTSLKLTVNLRTKHLFVTIKRFVTLCIYWGLNTDRLVLFLFL